MKNIVYKTINGRTGNQIFQTICGAYYAKIHDMDYIIVVNSDFLGNYLESKDFLFKNINYTTEIPSSNSIFEANERFSNIYTEIPYIEGKDILINGYRETPLYFTKEFAFEFFKNFLDDTKNVIYDLYGDLSKTISVNVRRGDKLKLQNLFTIPSKEYIMKCLANFDKSYDVLFTSDDIDWCKENFVGERFKFADKTINGIPKHLLDLRAASLCSNNIISNSTFGWWGAYFNTNKERKVFYTNPWYKMYGTNDIIPKNDNWVCI